ncbi:hypothetical protein D0C36_16710 [Mucilaginibacter conchicola]|uniref:GyrI-like small molecule binding domain-containing protein n=1 Tax=Mucilaginibacter conchicola TaxID=2303333 RepID=A0A372NPP2_9SPHI|nr:hypothetical protein [Mucilaginibacter conchicola]RFZ90610.1 hypothetical protein D0C36_16710 [Mucilaginibacter conchicola]
MKKWLIPAGILFLAAALALIPVVQTRQLTINSSYFNVYQGLAKAQNWAKWYPYLKTERASVQGDSVNNFKIKGRSSKIELRTIGLAAFNVNITGNKGAGSFQCVVTANPKMNVTDMIISRHYKLLGYLQAIAGGDGDETFIDDLKNYLEDPLSYYGFAMKLQTTKDQFLIVKDGKYLTDSVCPDNIATLNYLKNVAAKLKLKTGELRLQYVSAIKDSTSLILGIAIQGERHADSAVQYMQMPGSKVLAGTFKGKYKDRQQLYRALYLYMADHNMHQQTKPYETFINNQLPANDETIVDMQVIVPYV